MANNNCHGGSKNMSNTSNKAYTCNNMNMYNISNTNTNTHTHTNSNMMNNTSKQSTW